MMKASVVMASFLGQYEGSAKDRGDKFLRAVNSFLSNDYSNKELIVVGDCCEETGKLIQEFFPDQLNDGIIKFYQMRNKQPLFSGMVRDIGLKLATGDIVMYLDTDDMLGESHIRSVATQMGSEGLDWCYYNDFIRTEEGLLPKTVEITYGSIGTSSVAHKNNSKITWKKCDGYGHDFKFVENLVKWSDNYDRIYGASYIICHIPNQIDI